MRQTLKDIKVPYDEPIPIRCDSTSAINNSKNPMIHSRTKHISIRYHFLREKVAKKEVKLEYVSTKDQIADSFTKALSKGTFEYLKKKLGVIAPCSSN